MKEVAIGLGFPGFLFWYVSIFAGKCDDLMVVNLVYVYGIHNIRLEKRMMKHYDNEA